MWLPLSEHTKSVSATQCNQFINWNEDFEILLSVMSSIWLLYWRSSNYGRDLNGQAICELWWLDLESTTDIFPYTGMCKYCTLEVCVINFSLTCMLTFSRCSYESCMTFVGIVLLSYLITLISIWSSENYCLITDKIVSRRWAKQLIAYQYWTSSLSKQFSNKIHRSAHHSRCLLKTQLSILSPSS